MTLSLSEGTGTSGGTLAYKLADSDKDFNIGKRRFYSKRKREPGYIGSISKRPSNS
jgi:hypothetical protein